MIQKVNIADVIVKERLRPLGDFSSIVESIKELGLLEPIVISSDYVLVDGNHRLSACKQLGWKTILANVVTYTSDDDYKLAEIDANLKRNELTQFQEAEHLAERKKIFERKYPETRQGKNPFAGNQHKKVEGRNNCDSPPRFTSSTAEKTGKSERTVQLKSKIGATLSALSDLIIGSRFEDSLNELQSLTKIADPKKGEGIKVARQVLELALMPGNENLKISQAYIQHKKARAQSEAKKSVSAPSLASSRHEKYGVRYNQVWKLGKHTLICGDAYEYVDSVDADALVTDPPYGINYQPNWNKWDGSAGNFNPVINDDEEFDPTPFLNYSTVVLFGANYFTNHLPLGGWLCWDKRTREELDEMLGSPFELAWYRSEKTAKKAIIHRIQHGGVVNADSENGNNAKRFHPTQKPIELMRRVLVDFTNTGDVVFDPFSGSGSVLIACHDTERTCIACEIDLDYCEVILQRFHKRYNIEPCLG